MYTLSQEGMVWGELINRACWLFFNLCRPLKSPENEFHRLHFLPQKNINKTKTKKPRFVHSQCHNVFPHPHVFNSRTAFPAGKNLLLSFSSGKTNRYSTVTQQCQIHFAHCISDHVNRLYQQRLKPLGWLFPKYSWSMLPLHPWIKHQDWRHGVRPPRQNLCAPTRATLRLKRALGHS